MAKVPTDEATHSVRRSSSQDRLDEIGQATITALQQAATQAIEIGDQAESLADQAAIRLRAAEDHINELEAQVAYYRDRTAKAEEWLDRIHTEVQSTLLNPRPK